MPTIAKTPKQHNTVAAMRKRLGLNQETFWNRIGVTQSGGSRYENGRDMPQPVKHLFDLTYGDKPLEALARLRGVTVLDLTHPDVNKVH